MVGRTFVTGDVHGGHRALVQVLERCGFDYENDTLIFLGDVADGWPETWKCIDELLKIKNLIHLLGNHDQWTLEWATMSNGVNPYWKMQGGSATLNSYGHNPDNVPISHIEYLKTARPYYIDDKNRVFVHGGWFPPDRHPLGVPTDDLIWDRKLLSEAYRRRREEVKLTEFDEVFVGHTTLSSFGVGVPTRFCNVWGLDTGGGAEWKLSIMDVDTKEFWQSDKVSELYPEFRHGMR